MANNVYVMNEDGELVRMNQSPYDTEESLQELLARHPELLAATTSGASRTEGGLEESDSNDNSDGWLLISREMPVGDSVSDGRWSLDHLFLDRNGVPTLVEVKRSSDTRIRREVVGQLLDYAANAVVYWPVEHLQSAFEKTCTENGSSPAGVMQAFAGSSDALWSLVKTNLQAGKIRLVFVADLIPPELERIVEFLNEQMDPAEVLAIEIQTYSARGISTLVPRVVGRTAQSTARKGGRRPTRRWDYESFFAEVARRNEEPELKVAEEIYKWAQRKGLREEWGRGARDGSFTPVLDTESAGYYPISVWTNGYIEVEFQYLADRPPFDNVQLRRQYLERLNALESVSIPETRLDKRPGISLSALTRQEQLQEFLRVLDWVLQRAAEG